MSYLSPTIQAQLKIMSDKAKLDTTRIGGLIKEYISSQSYCRMLEGEKYYNVRHDILDWNRYYYVRGQKTKSEKENFQVPHPFHQTLVDQKKSYIAGKPIVVNVKGANATDETKQDLEADAFQELISERLGAYFDDCIMKWIKSASNQGVSWIHFYINLDGELKYLVCPATEIIPVFDTQYENELLYVIRFYQYDLINGKGETLKRYKVEWWTKKGVEYWAQDESENFLLDTNYLVNPYPHWVEINTTLGIEEPHSWTRVPFIPLWNNSNGQNDLYAIKALIDGYDRVVSGWFNDVNEWREIVLILKGFIGLKGEASAGTTQLDMFLENLYKHGVISLEAGTESGAEMLKLDIPIEAKERLLEITRKAIFYFGRGVDVTNEQIGNAPSGVALQFLYANLDMKANEMIVKLKIALKDFFWFITKFINMEENTTYEPNDVTLQVNTSRIFNKKEIIDGNIARKGFLSDETLLGLDPDVDNVAEEMKRVQKQNDAQALADERKMQKEAEILMLKNKGNGQPSPALQTN